MSLWAGRREKGFSRASYLQLNFSRLEGHRDGGRRCFQQRSSAGRLLCGCLGVFPGGMFIFAFVFLPLHVKESPVQAPCKVQ